MTEKPLTINIRSDKVPLSLKGYEAAGGYQALRKALKDMTPKDVQKIVTDSTLKGQNILLRTPMRWSRALSKTDFLWRAIPISLLKG
jgi:NADH-quinone oxidoreductase subunit F